MENKNELKIQFEDIKIFKNKDPLISFIQFQLQELLKICEFSKDGKKVEVDGFILEYGKNRNKEYKIYE